MLLTHILPTIRKASAAVTLLVVLTTGSTAFAQSADQSAVNRAHAFLRTQDVGREVLNYVHMGADYHGHEYRQTNTVTDRNGDRVPGHFALVYRYYWENDGITDIAFLCNGYGSVYEVQINYTNAVLHQPFLLSSAAIQMLGEILIEAYKDKMNAEQLRLAHKLVNNADSKGLLEFSLGMEQAFQ